MLKKGGICLRIVVTSDTHRNSRNFFEILDRHEKNADLFINLGDSEHEIELLEMTRPNLKLKYVAGNCDFSLVAPYEQCISFNGKKVFFTHGHHYYVKHGYSEVIRRAKQEGADICLFGHTHTPYFEIVDGLYVLNPGAVCDGSYGIVDVVPGGIMAYATKI